MKEKLNQFMKKCKQNRKKTALLLLAFLFLFTAIGFRVYSLTTDNEPSPKVAEKEEKQEKQDKKKDEQSKKKKLDEEKESKLTTKKTEETKEKKPEEVKKEEASKEKETAKKTENKTSESKQPSESVSKPVAPTPQPSAPAPQQRPVEPQKPVHTHDFQPVYTQKWVVDQPAWTETVETPVYGMDERSICNTCGADITGFSTQHILDGDCGGYHSEWVQVQTGTKTETIQHPEVGHNENVISYYQCSCGATK